MEILAIIVITCASIVMVGSAFEGEYTTALWCFNTLIWVINYLMIINMKKTHKPYGDFAQKVGSKQPKIRNFPVDYCEICQRKTGTDMYSGECGGCLMDVLLKSRKSNLGGELEPLTWKELFWGTVIVVAIAIITVEVVTRISSLF